MSYLSLQRWYVLVFLGIWFSTAQAALVDLVVNQSDSPDPIAAGGLLSYTIVVTNNGPDDATGVALSDTIPVATSFSSVTTTQGTCSGTTTVNCSIGSLTVGQSATVVIKVVPTTTGTISNTVTSTRNETDTNSTNNTDTDITTVQTGTDLSISKTDSADPVSQGDSFSYSLVVRNNGPYALLASDTLTVTDNIPTGLRVSSLPSGTGWSCSSSLGSTFPQNGPFILTCTKTAALAVSTNASTITVPVMALSLGTITNQAGVTSTLRDDNATNDTTTQSTTVNQAADVAITKSVSQATMGLNQNYTYTLSPSLVLGTTGTITVSDTLPAGMSLTATPTGTGWTCTPNSGFPIAGATVSCTHASATNSSTSALSLNDITVSVKPTTTGTFNNTATIGAGVTDFAPSNNTSSAISAVVVNDVAISKSVSQSGNIGMGQTYSYTLTPSLVMGTTGTITVTDNFPSGANLVSAPTGTNWSCSSSKGASYPQTGPLTITCAHASAGNSGPSTLALETITYNFSPTTTGTLTNTTSISLGGTDTTSSNNTATVSNTVVNDAAITKTVSQSGNLGQNNTYSYTLSPSIVMGTSGSTITVTDTFPSGANLTALPTGTGWTCSSSAGAVFPQAGPLTITCTRAGTGTPTNTLALPNITASFMPTSTGSLSNTASINMGVTDTTSSNDTSTVNNTVINDLQVVKTASASSPLAVGSNYSYTLTATLNMGDTGGLITMVDNFPAGANLRSLPTGTGWTCSSSGGVTFPQAGPLTITCTRPTAVSASSSTFPAVTVSFSPTSTGTLSNTVTINSPATDTNTANNTSTINHTISTSGPDLTITKTASVSSVNINTNYTYSLVVRNSGPTALTPASLITVKDIIPIDVTVSAASGTNWSCSSSTGSFPIVGDGVAYVSCTRTSTLNAGSTLNTITLTAQGTDAGAVANTASVTTVATESDTTNNTSTVSITFNANYDLTLSKSDSVTGYGPDPVAQGDTLDYRLRVTNAGPTAVPFGSTVTVTDTLPTNTSYVSATGVTATDGWSCAVASGTVTCTRPVSSSSPFANGANSDIRLTIRVNSGAGTTMSNTANVSVSGSSESNTANNTASQSTTIRGATDLSITKTASATSVLAGQNLTYTITVTNLASSLNASGASNVRVTDDMTTNPGATFVSVTPVSGTWTCNNTISLTCTLTTNLAIGASASFQVTVKPVTVGTGRANTATVALVSTATVVDPDASNNTATVNVDVSDALDLFVTKTDAPDPVRAGTDLTYVITVGNSGPGTANTVTMTDSLPAEFVLSSITPSGTGTCTTSPSSTTYTASTTTVSPHSAFTTLNCTWATMPSSSQQTVTVIGRPTTAAATAGSLNNSVSISYANSATVPDTNSSNNSATQATVVNQPQIDLLVNKVDTPDPVALGQNMTYTVTVTNQGPSVATNIVLTENLPHTYLGFVSAVAAQGSCGTPVTNIMTCNLGNLEAGTSTTVIITMSANIVGVDTNTVSVSAAETDTNSVNNSVSENTTIQLGADLQLVKLASPNPVVAGNSIYYYLAVTNNGPANAVVTLVDTLPSSVVYVSVTPSQGSCTYNSSTTQVSCNFGVLPYGQIARATLVATAQVGGDSTNTATLVSSSPDPDMSNNTATALVTIVDGIVRGRVFQDDGAGSGTANDGLQSGTEGGVAKVLVRLTNCSGTEYANTLTDGNGDYQIIVPAALVTGVTLCVVETNAAGYRSTGGSVGTTAGTYTRNTDTTQFSYTDGVTYTGVNFADVAQAQLLTDGVNTTLPGATIIYPHTFIAGSDGSVSFSLSNIATPSAISWGEALLKDVNCNGVLDAIDVQLTTTAIAVNAGDQICLLIKEAVPAQATNGAKNTVTIQADFTYINLSPTTHDILTRNDITTVNVSSTLSLTKAVNKTTARPGEVLIYTITYRNDGPTPISNLKINDAVPAFTHNPIATCVLPLPANLTACTPMMINPPIEWNFSGTLAPNTQGQVQFTVTVDN